MDEHVASILSSLNGHGPTIEVDGNAPEWERSNGTRTIPLPVPVTLYDDLDAIDARTIQVRKMKRDDIAQLISETKPRRSVGTPEEIKKSLPLLNFCELGDVRSDKNCLRNDANVLSVFGVPVDYDDKKVPFRIALARLEAAQVEAIIYTSPSHTVDAPPWRVLFLLMVPLSGPTMKADYKRLVSKAQRILGDATLDRGSWSMSRAYFYGVINDDTFRVVTTDGLRLDELELDDEDFNDAADADALAKGFAYWCSVIGDHDGGLGFYVPIRNAIACWISSKPAGHNTAWLRQRMEQVIRKAHQIENPKFTKDDHVERLDKLIEWTVEQEAKKPPKEQRRSQSDVMTAIAEKVATFRSPDGTAFVDLEVKGHRETWTLNSKPFKRWLQQAFYKETGVAVKRDVLDQAVQLTEGRAQFDSAVREVYVRVARVGDTIYLDRADDTWTAIQVDKEGWRVVDRPDVRFRRTDGTLPLPVPISDGVRAIDELRAFVNTDDDDFKFGLAWILASVSGQGPYPILVANGEHGAGKTSTANRFQGVIDPRVPMSRRLPREDRDLYVAAHNAHCLHFENISTLPQWISDAMCSLATGGGFATRSLYENDEETIFRGMRPIVLDGIVDFVNAPDLADRSLKLMLGEITEEDRRTEEDINAAWADAHPRILGALLDVVSHGLKKLTTTKLDKMPRMADFARWIAACETALWEEGTFAALYDENREEALIDTTEADPFVEQIRKFVTNKAWRDIGSNGQMMLGADHWEGTATELLNHLEAGLDFEIKRRREWPKGANAASGALRRHTAGLRKLGIIVVTNRTEGRRTIILKG